MKNPENPQKSNAANAFIEKLTAIGNGWDGSYISPISINTERVYLYAFDFDSGYLWMGCVSFQSFNELILEVRAEGLLPASTINELDHYLTLIFSDNNFQFHGDLIDPTRKQIEITEIDIDFVNLVAQFAGSTHMIFEDGILEPSCHFILIRYIQQSQKSVFQNIALPKSIYKYPGALPTQQLQQHILQMIFKDQEKIQNGFYDA